MYQSVADAVPAKPAKKTEVSSSFFISPIPI
jgi:hypothetical protein